MHRLIVGDIHGCWDELQELLDRAGLGDGDEVISLGDFVDRGLGTPQVLAFLRDGPGRRAVQGNHERKHWRSFRGETDAALSQRITRWQLGDADYPAVCDWFARLPTSIELPEALCVHGMFEPGVPLAEQRVTVIVGTMSGDAHLQRTYESPWYELYDGEKPILVGHHNITGGTAPYVRGDQMVWGLDTCCYGNGALTGLLLPEFRLLSVPSRGHHWQAAQAVWRAQRPVTPGEPRPDTRSFHGIERLAEWLARQEDPDPAWLERLAELQALAAEAHRLAPAVHARAVAEHERLVALLAAEGLDPATREGGLRYNELVGVPALRALLHRLRTAALTPDEVCRVMTNPATLVAAGTPRGTPSLPRKGQGEVSSHPSGNDE